MDSRPTSTRVSYSRNHVRHLSGHAHIRCVRRDARRRFRDGSDLVAEQRGEAGARTVQFGSWRDCHGSGGILSRSLVGR